MIKGDLKESVINILKDRSWSSYIWEMVADKVWKLKGFLTYLPNFSRKKSDFACQFEKRISPLLRLSRTAAAKSSKKVLGMEKNFCKLIVFMFKG